MKKIALLATIIIIGFSMMCVQAADADFSGNWVLAKRIPSIGGVPIPNVSLAIKQVGNDLEVIRKLADEEKTIKSHYTLDGAENINTEPNKAGTVTIRSTSRWDNNTLTLEGSSTFEGTNKSITNKWKREYLLSENGSVLAVSSTIQTPFGEAVDSEVFRRNSSDSLPNSAGKIGF